MNTNQFYGPKTSFLKSSKVIRTLHSNVFFFLVLFFKEKTEKLGTVLTTGPISWSTLGLAVRHTWNSVWGVNEHWKMQDQKKRNWVDHKYSISAVNKNVSLLIMPYRFENKKGFWCFNRCADVQTSWVTERTLYDRRLRN